jgi:hypothetical protein
MRRGLIPSSCTFITEKWFSKVSQRRLIFLHAGSVCKDAAEEHRCSGNSERLVCRHNHSKKVAFEQFESEVSVLFAGFCTPTPAAAIAAPNELQRALSPPAQG